MTTKNTNLPSSSSSSLTTNNNNNNINNLSTNPSTLLTQSSFAYAPVISPSSPTISLLSSTSSSPTSSSSSPTQMNQKYDLSKKSALSNISAAISKHQTQKQPNTNTKLINLIMDNNGVACSLVKSNTNIYYNLKVDATTSKAIHYCDKCSNPDCKAIHKSLTKPLILLDSTSKSQQQQQQQRPTSLNNNNPNNMTRIFLSPTLQNNNQQIQLQPNSSQMNNKLSGANINFVFERRYPLNSESLNSGSVSPNSQHAPLNSHIVGHQHLHAHLPHGPKHIYIRPQNDETGSTSFPLPLSPQALQHAVAAAAALAHASSTNSTNDNKPTHFSINFNRLSPNLVNGNEKSESINNSNLTNDPFKLFPSLNLNSLRYKNTLFLDQFNKDQRSQSPTSSSSLNENDYGLNNLKIQTITSTNQTKLGQKQQPPQLLQQLQPQSGQQLQQPTKNEKDILVQKVINNNESQQQVQQQQQQQQQPISSLTSTKKLDESSKQTNNQSPIQAQSPSQIKQNQQITKSNNNLQKSTLTTSNKDTNKQVNIPQFYYPHGKPEEKCFKGIEDVENMKLINAEFKQIKDGKMYKDEFANVCKLLGVPKYWKILLFRACNQSSKLNYVTYTAFEQTWSKLSQICHERASLFMKLISTTNYITYEDWEPLLQDIVDSHPGLKFLHDHKEFHTRYIKTVIARIYYTVNRSWSGKINITELKRSNFLDVLETLELEDDINLIKDYFSYEHFYVIYCKFWELDKDHDLYISKEDLYRHNNYSISPKVIDRIFSGTVIRSRDWREGLMSYYDFVWFLISEEDKRNPTSVEYWFRVLDVDGDGVLSMYELEYFYNEQMEQMRERQIEFMPFTDLLCQMLDLVKPIEPGKIRLKDLKQCKMANVFFDTFINLEKYLEYEQRDPFSNMRDLEGPEQSDWEKYAAYEYENLVSEDVNGDNQDLYNNYEDDFEDEPLMFNNSNTNNNNNSNNNGNSQNGNLISTNGG